MSEILHHGYPCPMTDEQITEALWKLSGYASEGPAVQQTVGWLRAALAEAQRELETYRAEHEGCIAVWRAECTTVHAERDAALSRADSAERELAEAREVIREIATGNHGEYCGDRNAMLVQGGKSECYADCPVHVATAFLAREAKP